MARGDDGGAGLTAVFEHLQTHKRIAVTGPQRSGTTIAARMIAHDTGYRHVDEAEFWFYDIEAWRRILTAERVVVQCPHMLKVIVDDPPPGIFVVLMRRDLDAIHASERRIQWAKLGKTQELKPFGLTEGDPARLKYEYWDSRPKPPNFLELSYESLREHPLYIDPDDRGGFARKQTASEADEPDFDWRGWIAASLRRGMRPRFIVRILAGYRLDPDEVRAELAKLDRTT